MAQISASDAMLRLRRVEKRFNNFVAVDGIDLDIEKGEFLTLLGPSGCGKTTTLSMIAGFFQPTAGEIFLDGESIEDEPPFKRDTGMVFQDYALFPHMTVDQNVAFGLRMRKVAKLEVARRVGRALELVHLSGLGGRRPAELSGGQRQRVALARALVVEPKVLLLDEPLSNLDLKLREAMRLEITSLQRELGITAIYVTHDQSEALVMSTRIAVMQSGRIEQLAPPVSIYQEPTTRFVAEFIGSMNLLPARILSRQAGEGRLRLASNDEVTLPLPSSVGDTSDVFIAIRPERTQLAANPPQDSSFASLPAKVRQVIYLGNKFEYQVDLGGGDAAVVEVQNTGREQTFSAGDVVHLTAATADCRILPQD